MQSGVVISTLKLRFLLLLMYINHIKIGAGNGGYETVVNEGENYPTSA